MTTTKEMYEALKAWRNDIENHPSSAAVEHYKTLLDKTSKAIASYESSQSEDAKSAKEAFEHYMETLSDSDLYIKNIWYSHKKGDSIGLITYMKNAFMARFKLQQQEKIAEEWLKEIGCKNESIRFFISHQENEERISGTMTGTYMLSQLLTDYADSQKEIKLPKEKAIIYNGIDADNVPQRGEKKGWNDCIEETKQLNNL